MHENLLRNVLGTFPRFALFVCTVNKMHICTMCIFVHLCIWGAKAHEKCTFAHIPLGYVHLCIHVQSFFVLKMALADQVVSKIG